MVPQDAIRSLLSLSNEFDVLQGFSDNFEVVEEAAYSNLSNIEKLIRPKNMEAYRKLDEIKDLIQQDKFKSKFSLAYVDQFERSGKMPAITSEILKFFNINS